jgi:hypothetical protein
MDAMGCEKPFLGTKREDLDRRYVAHLPDAMALNPFEQLRLFLPEPRQAFEELVGMLLEDSGRIDGRIKIFCGVE